MKEDMLWRVGNGMDINIWSEPWAADDDGLFITSLPQDSVTKVNQLIETNGIEWNVELVDEIFSERDRIVEGNL